MANAKDTWSKIEKKIQKFIGGNLNDLLFHLPYRLDEWHYCSAVLPQNKGGKISIPLTVIEHHPPSYRRSFYKVTTTDGNTMVHLIFFKAYGASLLKKLPLGEKKLICGTLEYGQMGYQIKHPDHMGNIQEKSAWTGPIPIYPLTAGITNRMIKTVVDQLLNKLQVLDEWIPGNILREKKWPTFKEALQKVHHPQSKDDLLNSCPARERLAFDELLAHQLSLTLVRRHQQKIKGLVALDSSLENQIRQSLPFALTKGQEDVLGEIFDDLQSGQQMQRLLQGDVGSGKTIVALLSLARILSQGYQGAILVPTEVLAQQHFKTFQDILSSKGISVGLFTSDCLRKNRKEKLHQLETGKIQLAIGTHALLDQNISFQKLGMVVIDEQHRFGVEQRLKITQKSLHPHILVMTATPIPRSLTWTRYGHLSLSVLSEKPIGRQAIETRLMSLNKLDEIYAGLSRVLKENQKIFWVCPLIEESEKLDWGASENRYKSLEKYFPNQISFVHGRMDGDEQERVLTDFREGKNRILVSTTVIEVGFHVPDATIMVIENAERFGLSQLHQLRGRVGRGDSHSFCLLLYGEQVTETGRKRLALLRSTSDGFVLAEEDLKIRGGGDLLGIKQAGFPTFRMADCIHQGDLVKIAHETAQKIVRMIEFQDQITPKDIKSFQTLLKIFGKEPLVPGSF